MLKRILYTLALVAVLAFAPPAWAASYTWTNTNLCECWNVATNWDPNAAGGPTDGDIVTFDGNEAEGNLPDSQLLGGGNTVGFVFTAAYTLTINDLLNGAAIGTVTVNHASAVITAGADITGAITITSGTMAVSAARTLGSTVAIESNGTLGLDASGTVVASDTITMSAGSELYLVAGTTLDIAATKSLTGTALFISNGGIIQGTVNMTSCVWANVGTITVDEDGLLNLGTDTANDQAVTVTAAAVTVGDSFRCNSFTLNAVGGGLTVSDKTITVGAGGLTHTAGTCSAGQLSVVMAEATAVCNWATFSTRRIKALTVNAAVSLNGAFQAESLGGTDSLACGAHDMTLRPAAANFFSLTGGMTGTGVLHFYYPAGDFANAAAVNIGTMDLQLYGAAKTLTFNGAVTCADVQVYLACTTSFQAGLTASGNLVLGSGDNTAGHIVFGDGTVNTIAGTVAKSGTDTGHTLDLGSSHVTFGGNMTLAGIAADFGSAIIEASGDLTIDGTDAGTITNTDGIIFANGNTVTVDDLGYATTSAPIICVSCTPGGTPSGAGVSFQEPQRMTMGVGF